VGCTDIFVHIHFNILIYISCIQHQIYAVNFVTSTNGGQTHHAGTKARGARQHPKHVRCDEELAHERKKKHC